MLSDSGALADYLHVRIAHARTEYFLVLFLDIRNRLLGEETIGSDSAAGVLVQPRQILSRALDIGASGLILVHNHPSGRAEPSEADISTTRRLAAAARALDIEVHDHVVVAATGWTSLRALGLIGGDDSV